MKRLSSAQRGYDARWRRARRRYLRAHPLCVECLKHRVMTPAKVVDHLRPHRGDQELFWDEDNWQALCEPCHNRKTAAEDGAFGNPSGNKKVGGCDATGHPLHPDHPWNKANG